MDDRIRHVNDEQVNKALSMFLLDHLLLRSNKLL